MATFLPTIFLSAFLLFQVQPLLGKFILPWFGGSTAVWTTCMLFFQVWLLAGYAYAHLLSRVRAARFQAAAHICLLAAAIALLPIVPSEVWKPGPETNPSWQILLLLTVCVGVPYLALSSTAPLLQSWFSRLQPGASPYRLYALSNAGSLLALVSFPFLFEPLFSRVQLAGWWGWGLRLFAVAAAGCAFLFWRKNPPVLGTAGDALSAPVAPPPVGEKVLWFALPACASALLLAVTNKMCQDVAVIPFLWILPLVIYLASFILCFDAPFWYWRRAYHLLLVGAMGAFYFSLFEATDMPLPLQLAFYGAALFVCCMVCHGELYRLRPHPRYLTGYYLALAAGGALGGAFVALAAPLLFSSYLELHTAMLACVALLGVIYWREQTLFRWGAVSRRGWQVALAGLVLLAGMLAAEIQHSSRGVIRQARNFYGVLRVIDLPKEAPADHTRELRVGEIIHGVQFLNPIRAVWPTAYFHEKTGVGLALTFLTQTNRRVGLVGLGIGTLAAYGRPGDTFTFYEINDGVIEVARSAFTYLSQSQAEVNVILGDARLSLERQAPQQFDLLVLDAFSGDAIPIHLLTRQAFDVYLRHLKPDGVLAIHTSNTHLDLPPVVEQLAASCGLQSSRIFSTWQPNRWWCYPSEWVLLTRNSVWLKSDAIQQAARKQDPRPPRGPLWTDDHASLASILKRAQPMRRQP